MFDRTLTFLDSSLNFSRSPARPAIRALAPRFRMPGKTRRRRGATAVEFAIVLPFFLLFVFGLMEYGRARMINNLLKGSARTAARIGANEDVTTAEAGNVLRNMMGSSIDKNQIAIQVKDASVYDNPNGNLPETASEYAALPNIELSTADTRQLFLVRATVNYGDVAIVPLPWWDNIVLEGQAVMRHE